MGISERREREKAERRRAILKCAKEMILSQEVQQVSMEEIANKAELSKATVYTYFPSKEILLNEICEDAARIFLERVRPHLEADISGMEAIKRFWRVYVELFSNSDEMIIIFHVRNFISPNLPIVSLEGQKKSSSVETIIEMIKTIIDKCKADGFFDPGLDSVMATRLLLSIFSVTVENAARIPRKARKSPAIIEEITKAFQIIIRGFAREGIGRSDLNITG